MKRTRGPNAGSHHGWRPRRLSPCARDFPENVVGFPIGLDGALAVDGGVTFGLLHGFGFAGALSENGLPQNAIPLALLFFNIGVELGQLVFVGAPVAALLVARAHILWPRGTETAAAYAIGSLATFWALQRVAIFGSG